MIFCPNKNSKEFQELVGLVGENQAYFLWNKYKGEVPIKQYNKNNYSDNNSIPENVVPISFDVEKNYISKDIISSKVIEQSSDHWIYQKRQRNKFNTENFNESHEGQWYYTKQDFKTDTKTEISRDEYINSFKDFYFHGQIEKYSSLAEQDSELLAKGEYKLLGPIYTTNIKKDVDIIFKENPELANAVYEALGFVPKMITREGQEYFNNPRIRFFVKIADEVRASLPKIEDGYTRLYRGNRPSDLKSNPQFTNSLEGIALPFLMSYEGQLSYIDIPTSDLLKYVQKGGVATNAEFIVTPEIARTATPIDNTIVEKYKKQYPDKLAPVDITPQQKQQALQLYSQYLNTIFPDSKVKDIVYHGYKLKKDNYGRDDIKIEKFDKLKAPKGFYFTTDKKYANTFTEKYTNVKESGVIQAILNLKNPKQQKDLFRTDPKIAIDENKDGFVGNDMGFEKENVIVVFEPEQIHILSSKADIQGFKDFMAFENSEFSRYGTYQQFRDFIINKSSIEIENKLIETGKIDRVC